MIQNLIKKIVDNLSQDLLKPEYLAGNRTNPLSGHCYVAAETLYHLAGGKNSGLIVKRARDDDGVVHWWLEKSNGKILDPTAGQYRFGKAPYKRGVAGGFLTKLPSKRSKIFISRCS